MDKVAKLNIDLSEKTKSVIFVRAQKAGKTIKEYVLEKVGVLNIENQK